MGARGRQRRSLTNVGGAVTTAGDAAEAKMLAHALTVAPPGDADTDPSRAHVHGFHTYPARLHPETAARLIQAFAPPAGRVLDPFCGSGTVLVEALIHGRHALGTDLNPLAVHLAECKTRAYSAAQLSTFIERARSCAVRADARRKARSDPTHRFPREDLQLYEPHVLYELDSLRSAVEAIRDDGRRTLLSLVLSAVLVKFSRRPGDTSRAMTTRRTAPGFAARHFAAKAEDFAHRLADFAARLPKPVPSAFVAQDDATALQNLPPGPVHAIITSPPYAGTYDYVEHHDLRLRWLNLDATPLIRGELGGRKRYASLNPADVRKTWSQELTLFLHAAARILPAGGPAVLVMADSTVSSVALRADEIVAEVARGCGFHPAARASQLRPHFHGPTAGAFQTRSRREHAILLRRA